MRLLSPDEVRGLPWPHAEYIAGLFEFATKLGVQVYVGEVPYRAPTYYNELGVVLSLWPLGAGPRGEEGVYCSMGDGLGARGVVVLDPHLLSMTAASCSDEKHIYFLSALTHEVAHALVGSDELIATIIERAVARHLSWPEDLQVNLGLYAPDEPEADEYDCLVETGHLVRHPTDPDRFLLGHQLQPTPPIQEHP